MSRRKASKPKTARMPAPEPVERAAICPIAKMAGRLREVRAVSYALDRRVSETPVPLRGGYPINYLENAVRHSREEESVIRDYIAATRAASMEGAAMQLVELLIRLEQVAEVGDEQSSGCAYRASIRMIYSILHVVEEYCATSLADLIDRRFDNGHLDPWLPVDLRLAWLAAEAELEEAEA